MIIIITKVPKIPPRVESAFEIGPKNLKPPSIINKGINNNSEIVMNHEEVIGKSEKKFIFGIKLKGLSGESINLVNFG
jgi:hypothetical protein